MPLRTQTRTEGAGAGAARFDPLSLLPLVLRLPPGEIMLVMACFTASRGPNWRSAVGTPPSSGKARWTVPPGDVKPMACMNPSNAVGCRFKSRDVEGRGTTSSGVAEAASSMGSLIGGVTSISAALSAHSVFRRSGGASRVLVVAVAAGTS